MTASDVQPSFFSGDAAGDMNGDGIADVVLGAPFANVAYTNEGITYVLFGTTAGFPALLPLGNLLPPIGDGSAGFALGGIQEGDISGAAVSRAGDVNGDGIEDLVIGAYRSGPDSAFYPGASYVVFGSTAGFPAFMSLGSLLPAAGGDGSKGFVLPGSGGYGQTGRDVAERGDVNGDGLDDLIIGGRRRTPPDRRYAGESYVIYGSTDGFPAVFPLDSLLPEHGGDGSRGFAIAGVESGDESGYGVTGAGDINGDGVDDIVVGAPGVETNGRSAGAAYVVFGTPIGFPARFELATLLPENGGDGSAGFVLNGFVFSYTGSDLGATDINGDGLRDVIIGNLARRLPGGLGGGPFVVFGRPDPFPPVFELRSLLPALGGDGSLGFVMPGVVRTLGSLPDDPVSGAGDVNGDGLEDLIFGEAYANVRGKQQAGQAYVVFGSTAGFPPLLPMRELLDGDGSRGFVLIGSEESGRVGTHVAGVGDVNDDGTDDVFVSGPRSGDSSRAYIVYGRRADHP